MYHSVKYIFLPCLDFLPNSAKIINNIMEQKGLLARLNEKIGLLRPGWWLVHLAGISIAYALGHILWR